MKTKKAAMLRGALAVYLSPKLRGGARIDLDSALKNVTSANYSRSKARSWMPCSGPVALNWPSMKISTTCRR